TPFPYTTLFRSSIYVNFTKSISTSSSSGTTLLLSSKVFKVSIVDFNISAATELSLAHSVWLNQACMSDSLMPYFLLNSWGRSFFSRKEADLAYTKSLMRFNAWGNLTRALLEATITKQGQGVGISPTLLNKPSSTRG